MARTGTVSKWDEKACYGFVVDSETNLSYFVHRHSLVGTSSLRYGDRVEFEVGRAKSRPGKTQAQNVRKLNEAPHGD